MRRLVSEDTEETAEVNSGEPGTCLMKKAACVHEARREPRGTEVGVDSVT